MCYLFTLSVFCFVLGSSSYTFGHEPMKLISISNLQIMENHQCTHLVMDQGSEVCSSSD